MASLNLFLFLIYFYFKLLTFDWYLLEHIFFFIINTSSTKDIFALALVWFVLIFSIFLKCGLSPFFF